MSPFLKIIYLLEGGGRGTHADSAELLSGWMASVSSPDIGGSLQLLLVLFCGSYSREVLALGTASHSRL